MFRQAAMAVAFVLGLSGCQSWSTADGGRYTGDPYGYYDYGYPRGWGFWRPSPFYDPWYYHRRSAYERWLSRERHRRAMEEDRQPPGKMPTMPEPPSGGVDRPVKKPSFNDQPEPRFGPEPSGRDMGGSRPTLEKGPQSSAVDRPPPPPPPASGGGKLPAPLVKDPEPGP